MFSLVSRALLASNVRNFDGLTLSSAVRFGGRLPNFDALGLLRIAITAAVEIYASAIDFEECYLSLLQNQNFEVGEIIQILEKIWKNG